MPDNGRRQIAVLLGIVLACAGVTPEPAQADEPTSIRVVSYNVWGLRAPLSQARAERIERIGPALLALRPDVVALQEVWVDADAARLTADLKAGGLTHTHYEGEGLLGSGLLIASRYPFSDVLFAPFTLGGRPHHVWHGDYYANKGILTVRLATPTGTVLFGNTHLHARYGTADDEALQVTQALQVNAALGDRGAAILAGDLNSTEEQLPYRVMTRGARLTRPAGTFRIDWVLSRSGELGLETRSATQVLTADHPDLGRPLSDHPAVLAVIELQPSPPHAGIPGAADTPHVIEAAREALTAELDASTTRSGVGALIALVLLGFTVWLGRRARSAERRRRVWWAACAIAALLVALTLALAFGHEPALRSGLMSARAALN